MPHEHGPHQCYCPTCGYEVTADEYVRCNTLSCPRCGTQMRAQETGERRVSAVGDIVAIDDQPISATFFKEVRRLTDWITPDALEVQDLYAELTKGVTEPRERLTALHNWVSHQIRYVRFVTGKLCIAGKCESQNDLWQDPSLVIRTKVGNCANSAMLLTSLVRNELPAEAAFCVLGNLHSSVPGGHAWVKISLEGEDLIMEATSPKAPAMVPEVAATRYEPVHYFNDKEVLAIEGRTQMVPYAEAYSDWLADYLHMVFIEQHRRMR